MRCLGRFIALFILLFVVISLPCAIWMLTFWELDTNPDNFNRVVDEPVYERLAPLILPVYAESISDRQEQNEIDVFVAVIDNIDTQAWEHISERMISAEWLEIESKANFTSGLSYLNGDTNELSLSVNVTPVRERLISDQDALAGDLMREVGRLEDCTADQESDLAEFLQDSGYALRLPACNPSAAIQTDIRTKLDAALTLIIISLPDDGQWVFHEDFLTSHDISETDLRNGVKGTRHEFQMAKNMIGINFLFPMMLMGLIIIFAVRTAKEFFLWIGLALMLSGLLNVLPVMGLLSSANQPLEVISADTTDELWLLVGVELVNSLAREISGPIIGSTFIMVLFGFVSLVLATMLRPPQEEKQEVFYMPQGGSTPIPMTGMQMGSTPTPFPAGTGAVTPPQVAVPTPPPTPPPTSSIPDAQASSKPTPTPTPPPSTAQEASSQLKTDISGKLPEPMKPEGFADDRTYIPQNDLAWDQSVADMTEIDDVTDGDVDEE